MFTGLVEAVGEVAELKGTPGGLRLRLHTELGRELDTGASLAVNGVCLTVVYAGENEVVTDISPETARVTTLGQLRQGKLVNLERPLRADGRIGGHFVQGHIDATGVIEEIREEESFFWLTVAYPARLAPYIVRKGSVALDGISFTVAGLSNRQLDVQVVPYTWEHTNLRAARPADQVNVECDILGKYVVRAAEFVARNEELAG